MSNPVMFQHAKFLTSAPSIRHLSADEGIEVAFAGRSNAGKSSALNILTRQNSLARTSKTPGRTQQINIFEIDSQRRLVDLPGYGFAKVPIAMKEAWQKSLSEYLQERKCLRGLVVLMDIRHPFREADQELIHWAVGSNIPVLAVLTKSDKLKSGARKATLLKAQEAVPAFGGDVDVIAFSSLKRTGLEELESIIQSWFSAAEADGHIVNETP
ncbi:MAG TPA: ribosome biogenesis GTP-binding protein YihA/YsxC [Aliidiomarina sp.]|nr:ribosome biogenesis GTP-binding protein YihA/YsxC [Aliidiomarina sp.]